MPNNAIHLQCLCGSVHESASLLASPTLPLETEICHCNSCRYTSGALCPAFPELASKPTSLDACTRYRRHGGRVDRYFCTTCGSRTFDHGLASGKWLACSGIVEPAEGVKNVIHVREHNFVGDTKDGGLAVLMQKLGGREIPCYAEAQDSPTIPASELAALDKLRHIREKGRLFASCDCSSIQLHILPPDPSVSNFQQNPKVGRWLRANDTKYLALNCACNYCRRASGFSFGSNAYVLPENIVISSGSSVVPLFDYNSQDERTSDFASSTEKLREKMPELKFYFTSPGVRRSFCSVCGASAFFEREDRPQCVNVPVGLLRAESGVLAREWIEFDWRVWDGEEAVDRDLIEALEAQAKS